MFVTLEGPEGAGKSTVLRALASRVEAIGLEVVVTREPGSGRIGAHIRELLLMGEPMEARTELFLFLADRTEHLSRVVRPALARGAMVLCDRYADSTIVYQGYGRGLDRDHLVELNAFATDGHRPDLTLLLDLDPVVGLARLAERDRLDREPIAFHRRVREGFLAEAARDEDRWRVIDAERPLDEVVERAWHALEARMADLRA
jgi:dTMP kinase